MPRPTSQLRYRVALTNGGGSIAPQAAPVVSPPTTAACHPPGHEVPPSPLPNDVGEAEETAIQVLEFGLGIAEPLCVPGNAEETAIQVLDAVGTPEQIRFLGYRMEKDSVDAQAKWIGEFHDAFLRLTRERRLFIPPPSVVVFAHKPTFAQENALHAAGAIVFDRSTGDPADSSEFESWLDERFAASGYKVRTRTETGADVR